MLTEKESKELLRIGEEKRDGKVEESWNVVGAKFGMTGEQARDYVRKRVYKVNNDNIERVLVISDLHIPDHKEDLIIDTISKNKNVDTIILAGDILDCKAVSSYYNEEISILDYEMIKAHELLNKIRKITKARIILLKGNHEERVNTFYAKNAKAMGTSVLETEILYKLAYGFNVKNVRQKTRTYYEPIENVEYCDGRTYILGDLLVNHPSVFRKDYMKTVTLMYNDKFKDKYPNAKVFVIGHTHQLGIVYSQDGKILIESGCMCNPMSYADQDDRPFKLQQLGYVYLELKENKVDVDSIKIKYLGHDEVY